MNKMGQSMTADIRHTQMVLSNYVEGMVNEYLPKDVTPIEGLIIGFLLRHPDMVVTAKEVMDSIHVGKATVSKLLSSLEKKDYLSMESSSSDKRVKIILLTDKGLYVKDNISEAFKVIDKRVGEGFSEDEKKTLSSYLKRLRDNVTEFDK